MRARAVVLTVACAAASGCLAVAPRPARRPATSAIGLAQRAHEYPSTAPAPERASGASGSPTAAIDAFATAYINWDAQTVTSDMRELAARSVGQARSAMQLAAAQTAADYELQRGGIANSGTVETVASLRGQRNEYVVVTREVTTATATTAYQGLAPAWHVAIATVSEPSPGRWVLSGWQPRS